MGSEVADISMLIESVSGCGASQPACRGQQPVGRRCWSSVQTDGAAGVSSCSPDVCGDDDGTADGHRRLPPHLRQRRGLTASDTFTGFNSEPSWNQPEDQMFHDHSSMFGSKRTTDWG